MAKKGLGRGFDSLIPSDLFDESFDPTSDDDQSVSQLRVLSIDDIKTDSDQPRKHFDEAALNELTASIKRHGILQPIVVSPAKGGSYQIVAGERRYRASKLAGNDTIPALVRTVDGQHRLELALIENLQRHDLNSLETAIAYAKLRDQFNLTLEGIGQAVGGKSVSAVSNTLRLLKLPLKVQTALGNRTITEGQARPLIDVDPDVIEDILPQIIKEKWSARTIEQVIRTHKQKLAAPRKQPVPVYHDESAKLEAVIKSTVKIASNAKGKGTIAISFKDTKELQRIIQQLS